MAKQLTKAQEDYIAANWDKLSIEQIVKDTGCVPITVKKYVTLHKSNANQEKAEEDKVVQPIKAESRQSAAFGYGGKVGKNGGHQATIMTPGAAQIADEHRGSKKNNEDKPHIHKPRG